ncbi:hypothetical protein V6Z12_A13G191700 [Gossypium hirsutum]
MRFHCYGNSHNSICLFSREDQRSHASAAI